MHGIALEPYKPTQADLTYTSDILMMLKIGGVWGIPRCQVFYKKTGDREMKLENFLIPQLAKHMLDAGMLYEGMEHYKTLDDFKKAQASDHNAFKVCCAELGIKLDDSLLDEAGCR